MKNLCFGGWIIRQLAGQSEKRFCFTGFPNPV